MPFGATPSRWCVCQFHHFRTEASLKSITSRERRAGSGHRAQVPVSRHTWSSWCQSAVDFVAHLVDVGVDELVEVHHELAADVDALDIGLGGDEDQVGVGVFEDAAEAGWIDHNEVGELTGLEGA